MRLAASLGYPHYDHLLQHLTARQLYDWEEMASEQGLSFDRMDLQWALLNSTLANCHRDPSSSPAKVQDFLVYHDPYEEPVSREEMYQSIARPIQEVSQRIKEMHGVNRKT